MSSESSTKTRSFKVKLDSEEKPSGRYTGNSPYQAANKALSEIIRNNAKSGKATKGDINFTMIESTRGSKNRKEHNYYGKRIKLDKPVIYTVGDKEITKEYKNILRKKKSTSKSD